MKKLVSILMMFAMLLSFTACGNSGTGEESENLTDSASQTEQQTSAPEKETDSSSENTSEETEPNKSEAKALVVYFSCTGNTKAVAQRISELTGADLYEIVPANPYTDEDLNYNDDNCRANREMDDPYARPAIGSDTVDISNYNTVLSDTQFGGERCRELSILFLTLTTCQIKQLCRFVLRAEAVFQNRYRI